MVASAYIGADRGRAAPRMAARRLRDAPAGRPGNHARTAAWELTAGYDVSHETLRTAPMLRRGPSAEPPETGESRHRQSSEEEAFV